VPRRLPLLLAAAAIFVPLDGARAGTDPQGSVISGTAWRDANLSGLRDDGEQGVEGLGVVLRDAQAPDGSQPEIARVVTDADGAYRFEGVQAAEVIIEFRLPEQLGLTVQDVGDDDTRDSDADRFTGRAGPIPTDGGSPVVIDAGVVLVTDIVIGGNVWDDIRDDAVLSAIDPPLGGVTITLYREGRPRRQGAEPTLTEVAATQTLGGVYVFQRPASSARYRVAVNLPPGYTTVPRDVGNDLIDSDVDPVTRLSDPLRGDEDHVIDIGLAALSAISDRVWLDADGDGIQDDDEPGVPGVLVVRQQLVSDAVGWTDEDFKITDDEGLYAFRALRPGQYRVQFLPPEDLGFTLFQAGDRRFLDSDADPASGTSPEIILPDAADPILDTGLALFVSDEWDAGLLRPTTGIPASDRVRWVVVGGDGTPAICTSGRRVSDTEVKIEQVVALRQPDGSYRFLVRMAKGLVKDYSFAVVLYIRTRTGVLAFIWEVHDQKTRIGQIDPERGELIREDDGLEIFHDRDLGIIGFGIPAGVIPDDADVAVVQSFHTPTPRDEKRCHASQPLALPAP
jgi:hypothetical protein